MYFRQSLSIGEFISQLKNGTALPTGSASPYRLADEVATLLAAGEAEGELLAIGSTINGGQWKADTGDGQGYIGNFQCRLKFGQHETFANLAVSDVLTAMSNGGKTIFKLTTSPNVKKPDEPYKNVRCVKPMVVDVKDANCLDLLDKVLKFATEKSLSTAGG